VGWREFFESCLSNWEKISDLYDERFCRMWLFYLVIIEVSFRFRTLIVFQLQLTKKIDTLPINRDYIADWERAREPKALRERELVYRRVVDASGKDAVEKRNG